MKMTVLSPTGTLFDGEVAHANFPGEAGSFAVYPSHAPIISALKKGKIECCVSESDKRVIEIQSGFVKVKADVISVCVEISN